MYSFRLFHRLDIFLTRTLNREEKWAEFHLNTEREIEWQKDPSIALRPIEIRFSYVGDRLKGIAVEGVITGRKLRETVTTVNYYDTEDFVPNWIMEMVKRQIEGMS